jgi:hypothetical protein
MVIGTNRSKSGPEGAEQRPDPVIRNSRLGDGVMPDSGAPEALRPRQTDPADVMLVRDVM